MTRDKLIACLAELKEKLNDESITLREIKALYFGLNLDYIKFCEAMRNGNYYPSKTCDAKMKDCNDNSAVAKALTVVKARIKEIETHMK